MCVFSGVVVCAISLRGGGFRRILRVFGGFGKVLVRISEDPSCFRRIWGYQPPFRGYDSRS